MAGHRLVPVEIGRRYTDDDWAQQLMTINEFCTRFVEPPAGGVPGYLAQYQLFDQIDRLANDVLVPDYCYLFDDAPDRASFVDKNAWFGPARTVSPLHTDPRHNLLCQVFGAKRALLAAPADSTRVYPHTEGIQTNTSMVDVEAVDEEKYPLMKQVILHECVIRAGEMLFIPRRWWHHLRSLSTSFSVSLWFGRESDE